MKKFLGLVLTIVTAVGLLSAFGAVGSVSSGTWDPNLGWDFQCHSHTHPYFDKITDNQIAWELESVDNAFIAHGYSPPDHHAYPYGTYEDPNDPNRIINVVSQYRLTGRTAWSETYNYQPIDNWYIVWAEEVKRATPERTWKGWIDDCVTENTLLVMFTHAVVPNPGGSEITPEKLAAILDYALGKENDGLRIMTFAEAYDNLTTSPPPSPTPILVWTFDGVSKSIYTYAYPIFQARGLKGTTYLVTDWVGQENNITWEEIDNMRQGL